MLDVNKLVADYLERVGRASDIRELDAARTAMVGRNAPIPLALRDIAQLPADLRGLEGRRLNAARERIETCLAQRELEIEREMLHRRLAYEVMDVTLPGRPTSHGDLHVLTRTRREIEQVFTDMGYAIAEGPEVEAEFNNFTALNIPEDHPAKADTDTLWVSDGVLLRTHTSPVQVRVMQAQEPPVAVVCPGRVYRRDTQDATHSPIFHQVEGLLIDEGITLANLKGTLEYLTRRLFGEEREIRLRSGFFPFTEPSIEVDVSWGDGWMEILGAGMVDPNVLAHVGYDPDRWTGFAFGVGIERVAMLRYGISDIRHFFDNDARFLAQVSA